MGRLQGQVAVVTGAARGIGRETARALAEEGAHVAIVDLDATEQAADLAHELEAAQRQVLLIDADLSRVADCRRLIEEAVDHFGQIDVLVNNAGVGDYTPFLDITEDEFDTVIATNLKGTFFTCQAVVPHMRRRGHGKIINLGSEQMYSGYASLTHYTASKGAIASLTKSLAVALAPDIRVNTVAPGPTLTDAMRDGPENIPEVIDAIPLKRFATTSEVARTIVFLASPDGDPYTGQTLDPNMGTVMP
ncbi:MAG: 3-oxoacyl-ACP reductase FabG [Actinobacteria bacterium]|nr:3-oxoacyl-ACP reductase FabG [Actinomycetota bacterium]